MHSLKQSSYLHVHHLDLESLRLALIIAAAWWDKKLILSVNRLNLFWLPTYRSA